MNVKKLKELLDNLPDDTLVVLQHGSHEYLTLTKWNLEKDKTLYSDEGPNPYSLRDFRSDDEEEYQALVLNRG